MRIIHRGTPPTEETRDCECRTCGTEFEFERREATVVPDQRDGDALKIECPVCRHACWVAA